MVSDLRVAIFVLIACHSLVWGQSGELEQDETSIVESFEAEDEMDRTRLVKRDLRKAGLDELLVVPGLRQAEALLIVEGVRSGRIAELRQVDLIPGIQPGTAEALVPYFTLDALTESHIVRGLLRSSARAVVQGGPATLDQHRQHVVLTSSSPGSFAPAGLLSIHVRGADNAEVRLFSSSKMMNEQVELSVGHLRVRMGSPLLDAARRPGLYRPSDWERSVSSMGSVRPGSDDATMRRGATVAIRMEDRSWIAAHVVDAAGISSANLSGSEAVMDAVRLTAAWRSENQALALGVIRDGVTTGIRLEAARDRIGSVAALGHVKWSASPALEMQYFLRHFRGITGEGVPRQGGLKDDEDGGSMSISTQPSARLKLLWTVDVSRLRSRLETSKLAWRGARGASIFTLITLGKGTRIAAEGAWNRKGDEKSGRMGAAWEQRAMEHLELRSMFSMRMQNRPPNDPEASRLIRFQAAWAFSRTSLIIRWTQVRGSTSIQFWNVGPGPAALGLLRPLSGHTSLLQAALQSSAQGNFRAALVVSAAWANETELAGREDLSSSILFEFHL